MEKDAEYKNNDLYVSYMRELEKHMKNVDREIRHEICKELDSHIYENMLSQSSYYSSEEECLSAILLHLGSPEKISRQYLAEINLNKAIKSRNPILLFKQVLMSVFFTGKYVLVGILYLFSILFLVLSVFKIIFSSTTGLFIGEDNFFVGFASNVDESMTEVLGYWFVPICIVFAVILYCLGTITLKRKLSNS